MSSSLNQSSSTTLWTEWSAGVYSKQPEKKEDFEKRSTEYVSSHPKWGLGSKNPADGIVYPGPAHKGGKTAATGDKREHLTMRLKKGTPEQNTHLTTLHWPTGN